MLVSDWHLEPIRLCPLIWHWSLKSLFDSYACVPVWHLEPITSCPLVCVLWLTFIAGELFLHWYSSGWSFTSMAFTTHKGSKCLNHMCSHVKRVKSNTLTTIELYEWRLYLDNWYRNRPHGLCTSLRVSSILLDAGGPVWHLEPVLVE